METLTLKSSKNRRSLLNTFAPLVKWELGTTKQEWQHICMPSATMSHALSKTTNPSSSSLDRVLKKNDIAKRIFFQKSNKWDAARDVLQLEGRQQALHHCEREKRKYEKQNSEYYNSGIVDSRKEKKALQGRCQWISRRTTCFYHQWSHRNKLWKNDNQRAYTEHQITKFAGERNIKIKESRTDWHFNEQWLK